MTGMADVLAAHRLNSVRGFIAGEEYRCICGRRTGDHEAHQAAMLSAAGFGDLREAQAQALEDAADGWWQRGDVRDRFGPWEWLRARAAVLRGQG